jgi:UDP-N-acetylmuramoylalanine--D-glutamate ligase
VDRIASGEWVVLELSSFQLEDLQALERRPEIAVVTNLSPNHLDRHRSYARYLEAKRTILEGGPPPRVAVLNGEDPMTRHWAQSASRRVVFFGRGATVLPAAPGVWLREEQSEVVDHRGRQPYFLFRGDDLRLIGRFNLLNAAAAAAAALEAGVEPGEIRAAVRDFRGLEHRLEHVATIDGVEYINDSISTTPESTIAALEALRDRVILVCGGSSKGTPFDKLSAAIAHFSLRVIVLGETAGEIERAVLASRRPPPVFRASNLEEAVGRAARIAGPGDRVLLSPMCPSYDQFVNFAERGRRFKELVRARL